MDQGGNLVLLFKNLAGELKYLNGKLFGDVLSKQIIFLFPCIFPCLKYTSYISHTVLESVVRMLLSVSKQKIIFCCRRSCEKGKITVC